MSTKLETQNKALIREYIECAFNIGDDILFDQFFAPTFVDHNGFPEQKPGPEGVRDSYKMWRKAFPDTTITIKEMIAEEKKVVIYTTLQATHQNVFMNIHPTNQIIRVEGMSIFRIANNQIVERWGLIDAMGLWKQLGGGVVLQPER